MHMEILIYRRQKVDNGKQNDITCLVPQFTYIHCRTFGNLSTKDFSGTIKNCVPRSGSSMGYVEIWGIFNTLKPTQDGRHFPDDIYTCIFLNENEWHSIKMSLKFVAINNFPALVQIMAWRRPGNKPLSEPMMVVLPIHICVTLPQWVNS